MLQPLLTLLAAKAKAGALVAGTALATTAVVGGGTVAYQAVSDETAVVDATAPGAAADADVAAPATPTATIVIGIGQGKGKGAENRSATATAVLESKGAAPAVTFTCDPSKNHGQNVSAYAKSLPKGPGRGQAISQAAQSDCGKDVDETAEAAETDTAETAEADEPVKAAKAAKADKPARAQKPAPAEKPGRPASSADEPTEDESEVESEDESEVQSEEPRDDAPRSSNGKGNNGNGNGNGR